MARSRSRSRYNPAMRSVSIFVVTMGGLAATFFPARAGEWPQFRGPNSSGIAAADAAPPVEFGPSKRLLWKRPLPVAHSSPAVWGDRGFVTTLRTAATKLELICLAAATGAILWRRAGGAPQIEETHVVSNPATASPAADAE